jgi:hypothetical protein
MIYYHPQVLYNHVLYMYNDFCSTKTMDKQIDICYLQNLVNIRMRIRIRDIRFAFVSEFELKCGK